MKTNRNLSIFRVLAILFASKSALLANAQNVPASTGILAYEISRVARMAKRQVAIKQRKRKEIENEN
jgi:hypothetical protein